MSSKPKGIDWDSVFAAAKESGAHAKDIARAAGCTKSAVHYAARKRGVVLPCTRGRIPRLPNLDAEFRAAVIAQVSPAKFCLEHDISPGSLSKLEKRHGMKLPRKRTRHHGWGATAERAA